MKLLLSLVYLSTLLFAVFGEVEEDPETTSDPTKRQPSKCEVCKYLVTELQTRLKETGKNKEILRLGHGLDENKKRKVNYQTSELRLTEALTEPHICKRILEYNVHAERKGSLRYAKGRSETMETLHGLVNKGVKVELGIPYELWDEPSAEVSIMQRNCFKMVEDYEDDIENWYYNEQGADLMQYLCADRILKKHDQKCLAEVMTPKKQKTDGPSKKNKKGDDGKTDDNSTKHPEGKKTKTDKRNKSTEDREKQSTVDDNTTEKRAKASNIPKRDEF